MLQYKNVKNYDTLTSHLTTVLFRGRPGVPKNVQQSERYSDWYDSDNNCNTASIKDYSMIDHVLVTSGIKNKISDVYFYHGYSEYCGTYNSDHYPVVIDLNI